MPIRRTIHLKLALVVSLTALLMSALSAWLVYAQSYGDTLADSERSLTQLMTMMQETGAVAAFTGNRTIALDVVGSLSRNDLVRYARITGQNGLDAHAGKSKGGTARELMLAAPFDKNEIVGRLLVEGDNEQMARHARDEAFHAAAVLALQTLLVAVTVYLAVYRQLSRPLTRLSGQLHEIIPGSSSRLPAAQDTRGDELARLTADINALLAMVQQVVQDERGLREQVSLLEKRFRGIFESASIGIVLMDGDGQLLLANPAFLRLLDGVLPEAGDWVPRLFQHPHRLWMLADDSVNRQQPVAEDLQTPTGWLHTIVAAGRNDEGRPWFQCLFYDISERKAAEEAMRRLADFDHLTGIYNRQAGDRALQRMVAQAQAARQGLAVLMIDLDRFKLINDTYGHEAGDAVLTEVARRLRAQLRSDDVLARLGGDEFMVVLGGLHDYDFVLQLAAQLQGEVSRPICLRPGVYDNVGASIGIACHPMHGDTGHDLCCNADRAMYEVKRKGRNGYAVFQGAAGQQEEPAPPAPGSS